MRLFFAFAFPERIKQMIARNVSILQREIPKGVKWVETENLHITFRFLGEVNSEIIDDLSRRIENVTKEFAPFSISFGEIKVVPNFYHPRIIWYEMIEEKGIAQNIFREVETELVKIGFKNESRPLKLHTTLCRIKYVKKLDWQVVLKKVKPLNEMIACNELILFKSVLTSSGPIYSIAKKFRFE